MPERRQDPREPEAGGHAIQHGHVSVIASLNVDWTVSTPRIPGVGETILGDAFARSWGGKGANQAVAAARMGSTVRLVGALGADDDGAAYRGHLAAEGLDTRHVDRCHQAPTGRAIITVARDGANSIVVVPGANAAVGPEMVRAALADGPGTVVLGQLEVPAAATAEAFRRGRGAGSLTVLNPAPVTDDVAELLPLSDVLIPNEVEFEHLTGHAADTGDRLVAGAQALFDLGVSWVVVTLGSRGVALIGRDGLGYIDAQVVDAVDTTAAGDSFIGGFVHSLAAAPGLGRATLARACRRGTAVAAWSVQRPGAQSSMPRATDLDE